MPPNPDLIRILKLENDRLKEENDSLLGELGRLRQAIGALGKLQGNLDSISPESEVIPLIHEILSCALEAVDSESGSLLLQDEDTGELVFVDVQGPKKELLLGYRLAPGEGIAGWVASTRTAQLVPDVRQEPRFSPLVDQAIDFRTSSLICVPLVFAGRTLGVIEVVNTRSGEPLQEKDLQVMLLVSNLASQALGRAEGGR